MIYERDVVSVQFDGAARDLLRRAYQQPGEWTLTYLPRPSPLWLAWGLAHGVDLYSRDRWGEIRWIRAYKRAVYWNLANYGHARGLGDLPRQGSQPAKALVWETGKLTSRKGWPTRRWAIRVKLVPGGRAAERHTESRPVALRYTENEILRSTPYDRG